MNIPTFASELEKRLQEQKPTVRSIRPVRATPPHRPRVAARYRQQGHYSLRASREATCQMHTDVQQAIPYQADLLRWDEPITPQIPDRRLHKLSVLLSEFSD